MDNNAALRNLSALVDFSNLINSTLDLNFTLNNILLTCFGKFHTTKGLIALKNEEQILEVSTNKGLSQEVVQKFPSVHIQNCLENHFITDYLEQNDLKVIQEIKSSDGVKGVLILGKRLTNKNYEEDDLNFLKTILNVGATAIENSVMVERLKLVNHDLDGKVNQLSSLFDLSKEFSGVLELNMVSKLLVYSLIGQMFVSKYAVVTFSGGTVNILENRFDEQQLKLTLKEIDILKIDEPIRKSDMTDAYSLFNNLAVDLVVPMKIKGETKGLILLGHRKNQLPYTKTDMEFVSSVGSLAIISIENARLFIETLEKQRLEKDLETARNIQNNLLPKKIPILAHFEISTYNKAARMVGGDYYDIVKLDNNRLLFAIADVSGKGVPAALLMANIQAFLKSISKMNLPLSDSTNLLNDLVAENTSMGSFITFFWGILHDDARSLSYVNAGHNPPLLIRNSAITKLKKGGMILGVMETIVPYLSDTVQLETGDALVLFTDGITEAMNTKWEEYSDEKLEELSCRYAHASSEEILNQIMKSVEEFTIGAEQSDDITCLVIKVK